MSKSNSVADLKIRIEQKNIVVGVIGLGYVGLAVACEFARVGFRVIGVDVNAARVAAISNGISPIEGDEPGLAELLREGVAKGALTAVTDYACLAAADVVTINVDTPVDEWHRPNYAALRAASASLGRVLKPGALVIVESTVAPGTVDGLVRTLIEEASGQNAGEGFLLGACPERVMPGKLLRNLRTLSRVCGGGTPATAELMVVLYRHIVQADLDVTDIVTAELVKTAENAYRDVNIAFANEVALICEVVGGDVWRVRELVNKSPGRNMLMPGAGVGGHCIPKDPWLLAHAAEGAVPVPMRLIPAARAVNDAMPLHVAGLVCAALGELESAGVGGPNGAAGNGRVTAAQEAPARVAVLGYAYLENSDDTRNSPSKALVAELERQGIDAVIHDPWIDEYKGDIYVRVSGCDVAVLMVAHSDYRQLDLGRLRTALRQPILVDGRGVVDRAAAEAAGLALKSVGR